MLWRSTIIMFLFFLGCSKQTTSPIERFGVLLPLATENRWTYLEKSSETGPATIAEWSIKETVEVDSLTFFIIDTNPESPIFLKRVFRNVASACSRTNCLLPMSSFILFISVINLSSISLKCDFITHGVNHAFIYFFIYT